MTLSLSPALLVIAIIGLTFVAGALLRSTSVVLELIGDLFAAFFVNLRALALVVLIVVGLLAVVFLGLGQPPTAVG